MKKMFLLGLMVNLLMLGSCKKDDKGTSNEIPSNLPRTDVPAALQGTWMYGTFSMTEYWNQNPADYLGNALTMAIAFKFNTDGTYEQYFTSSSVTAGAATYQQAVTKGTVVIDLVQHTITTHPANSHYKRTRSGTVLEERDLRPDEISSVKYFYEAGTTSNGTKALYLALSVNENPLAFLKK